MKKQKQNPRDNKTYKSILIMYLFNITSIKLLLQENESYLAAVKVKYQVYFLHVLDDFELACVQLA